MIKAAYKVGAWGFTLTEIMIVVLILGLLIAIAIPNLLRARMIANEASAQATLKTIAAACETFAAANHGTYPTEMDDLRGDTPPYLSVDYTVAPRHGYDFACGTLGIGGYSCTATPAGPTGCNRTGSKDYTITTGAAFSSGPCS